MRNRHKANGERACRNRFRPCRGRAHGFGRMAMLGHLVAGDVGSEGTRIDRRAKLFPIVPHGANVVFVRVGDEDRLDPVAAFFQPRDVGKDQVHAR